MSEPIRETTLHAGLSEEMIRHDLGHLYGSDHWGHLAAPLDALLDAKDAEIARLRAALAEVSRRNMLMRDHLTGRLEGEAANHFFRPMAGTERIITEALAE